jgi:hypothetical protein
MCALGVFMDLIEEFLDACREEFVGGNNWALMQTLYVCAIEERPLPAWAASAYRKAYEQVRTGVIGTWDIALGPAHRKGTHLAAIRKRAKNLSRVYARILEILEVEPRTPIDKGLFERVGTEFGLGATLTEEFYYAAKKINSGG